MAGVHLRSTRRRQAAAARRAHGYHREPASVTVLEPPAPVGVPVTVEGLRPIYRALLAGGTDRFFEPRRTASGVRVGRPVVRAHLRGPVRAQARAVHPGAVRDCRRVFQNPRLTGEGLDFYYRDVYDGLNAEKAARRMKFAR